MMIEKLKNISKWQIIVIIFFLVIFVVGLLTFKDYGISEDERLQRNHSLITHYYLESIFNHKNINKIKEDDDFKLVCRKKNYDKCIFVYNYKYYGVAIQMPLTFIEKLFNYKLDVSTMFLIRHFYTFLLFFLSLIYFYKILTIYIIKDKKLALLGVLFMILSPRIYGEAFYNIKDNTFMALAIINLFYSLKYINDSNKKNLLILCFISALTINCRVIGGIIIAITTIFKMILDKKDKKKVAKDFFYLLCITYIIYIIITPASWNNVLLFPIEVIKFFFNYNDPYSNDLIKVLYFGKNINSTSLPGSYLPVWIFITTPVIFIVLSIIGFVSKIKNKIFKNITKEWLLCNVILVFTLTFIIVIRPTIYCGWRHFYFLYPIIIINSIIGFKILILNKKVKKYIIIILILNLTYLTCWIVKNHPYQYNFYNLFVRKYSIANFDFNYVRLSNTEALKYIVKHNKGKTTTIYSDNYINPYLLPEKERKKFTFVYNLSEADYIVDNKIKKNVKYNKNYKEIYSKKMDGYRLYTIYKKE